MHPDWLAFLNIASTYGKQNRDKNKSDVFYFPK